MQAVKSPPVYGPQLKLLILACGLAMLGGLIYLSPAMGGLGLVLVTFGVIAAWMIWSRPELGLLAISFFGTSLVARDRVVLPLGGFNLDPADVILVALLAVVVTQGLRLKTLRIPGWSMNGPLLAFAGFALFSALFALSYQRVSTALVIGELRPALYCAGCAIATATLVRRQQMKILLVGLFAIADLTAGVVIRDQFPGVSSSLGTTPLPGNWQISLVDGMSGGFGSVRVVPAGHVLVYLMANVAFCLLIRPPRISGARVLFALQSAILGVSLLLSYTRAQWVASGIAVLLICAFLPRATKGKLGNVLFIVIPVLAVFGWIVGSQIAPTDGGLLPEALSSRITSIVTPTDTLSTDSLAWRLFENEQATASLINHPILGVGLGNDYRSITLFQGEANGVRWNLGGDGRLTRWVHNSYFYVAVKMGILALGAFFVFCLAFLVGGTRAYFSMPDSPEKFVTLAIVSSFAGLLEWVIFEAHLMLPGSMMTVGLMVGIVSAMNPTWLVVKNVTRELEDTRPNGSLQ
jgi:O-antigen ligase